MNTIRGRRILVVDDDEDTRELAAEALTQAGALVTTVASAETRLRARGRRRRTPSSPTSACRSSAATTSCGGCGPTRGCAGIPTVALTAYGGAEARDAALGAGFSAYVRKPYDPRALVALLSGLIASHEPQA